MDEPTATHLYNAVKATRAAGGHRVLTIPEINAVLNARSEHLAQQADAPSSEPSSERKIFNHPGWPSVDAIREAIGTAPSSEKGVFTIATVLPWCSLTAAAEAVRALVDGQPAPTDEHIDGRDGRAHALIARFLASELAGELTEPNDTHRDVASDLLSELRAAGLVYDGPPATEPRPDTVLWEGETRKVMHADTSLNGTTSYIPIPRDFDVPPGTRVRVVAVLDAAGAPKEPDLDALCECGHRAGAHGHHQGIPDSQCYEHVDVEEWCPCDQFRAAGAPTDQEASDDG